MKKQLLFIGTLALLISVVMSSCSNFRYTDYGKPLDFLHAKRYKAKTQKVDEKRSSEETLVLEETKEAPIVTPVVTEVEAPEVGEVAVAETVEPKQVVEPAKATEARVVVEEVAETQLAMEETSTAEVSKKQLRKLNNATSTIRKFSNSNTTETTADILIILLCFLLPPLAVFLVHDIGREFWINIILLFLLFGIGAIIHALIVCL